MPPQNAHPPTENVAARIAIVCSTTIDTPPETVDFFILPRSLYRVTTEQNHFGEGLLQSSVSHINCRHTPTMRPDRSLAIEVSRRPCRRRMEVSHVRHHVFQHSSDFGKIARHASRRFDRPFGRLCFRMLPKLDSPRSHAARSVRAIGAAKPRANKPAPTSCYGCNLVFPEDHSSRRRDRVTNWLFQPNSLSERHRTLSIN